MRSADYGLRIACGKEGRKDHLWVRQSAVRLLHASMSDDAFTLTIEKENEKETEKDSYSAPNARLRKATWCGAQLSFPHRLPTNPAVERLAVDRHLSDSSTPDVCLVLPLCHLGQPPRNLLFEWCSIGEQ